MNIQSSIRAPKSAPESQGRARPQGQDSRQQEPRDTFLQNVGQFVEGAIPMYGARPVFVEGSVSNYTPGEFTGIFMGQAAGCYFGLMAGMMHAGQGLQGAAVGYGIAGIGLLASGLANAHANHATFS
jgi:hypothetical protein